MKDFHLLQPLFVFVTEETTFKENTMNTVSLFVYMRRTLPQCSGTLFSSSTKLHSAPLNDTDPKSSCTCVVLSGKIDISTCFYRGLEIK